MEMPAQRQFRKAMTALPDANAGVEDWSQHYARRDAEGAECEIAGMIARALDHWRLDDAIFWQRVRLRTSRIRALARHDSPNAGRAAPVAPQR